MIGGKSVYLDDCERTYEEPMELTKEEIELYWDRLQVPNKDRDEDEETKIRAVIIKYKFPYKLGLELVKRHECPLSNIVDKEIDYKSMLEVMQNILKARYNRKEEKS